MCEHLSWETDILSTDENDGVYALNECEVDVLLSTSNSLDASSSGSVGDCTSSEGDERPASMKSDSTTATKEKKLVTPPCDHNSWDNIRAKRGCMTLRCRVCQQKWKAEAAALRRCRTFAMGSCRTRDCQKTHIHRFKQSVETRIAASTQS
eukprot:TRINITY_DN638_c0_g1_i1.p1 TRINITY_DN638_c0_g1~~TRINITY_DN638_c0_g1_i1.p1  ORF type:complete len:151 (+),score=25.24 TRINITY_DN638_c0_g1_i1:83-535(+)